MAIAKLFARYPPNNKSIIYSKVQNMEIDYRSIPTTSPTMKTKQRMLASISFFFAFESVVDTLVI